MTMHERQQQNLGIVGGLLMQMFGRPKGLLGRLGGIILARTKRDFIQWVIPFTTSATFIKQHFSSIE
jgi:hypothetical protein